MKKQTLISRGGASLSGKFPSPDGIISGEKPLQTGETLISRGGSSLSGKFPSPDGIISGEKPLQTGETRPYLHHRRSIRLQGYDYSQPGAYFITIVIHSRKMILGNIVNETMQLSPQGKIVRAAWLDLPRHYRGVQLAEFCIMPNHFHGIIVIADNCRGGSSLSGKFPSPDGIISGGKPLQTGETRPYPSPPALPEIVRAFKSFSARQINALTKKTGTPVWQRNYYEHIIRNDMEWNRIRGYILDNIRQWAEDDENPDFSVSNLHKLHGMDQ